MIRLPKFFRDEAGAGDERAGDAKADKKFTPVDRRFALIGCAHFNC